MNVLDTFYLLFKSNADELVKGNDKALKSTQATDKALREQKKSTDEVGKSFVQLAESLGGVVTAFLSLDAIKGGLANAQKTTASLQMQSKWLGQNAGDLAAYGNAVTTAGGTVEGFQATIKRLHDQYAQSGIVANVPMIMQNLVNTAREWDRLGYSQQQKETFGLRLGLDEGTILLMSQGADAMQRLIDERKKLLDLTSADTEAARSIQTEWDKTIITFNRLYNKINTDLAPILKDLFSYVREFVGWLAGNPHWAEALIVGIAALGTILSGGVIAGIIGLGTAAASAAAPFIALAAAIGAVAAAANKLPGGFFEGGQAIGREINKFLGRGDADGNLTSSRSSVGSYGTTLGLRNNNPGNLRPGGHEASYATPEAGISALANNLRRYGRNGWNTIASIISHWAPASENNTSAYIAAVSAATGFSPNQPLDLNDASVLQKLSNAIIKHENGSNPYDQSQIRQSIALGQQALNGASSSPFNASGGPWGSANSSSVSVKIDSISVQTQATDANGIASAIGTSLKASLRSATSNFDDGVLA